MLPLAEPVADHTPVAALVPLQPQLNLHIHLLPPMDELKPSYSVVRWLTANCLAAALDPHEDQAAAAVGPEAEPAGLAEVSGAAVPGQARRRVPEHLQLHVRIFLLVGQELEGGGGHFDIGRIPA